MIKLHLGSRHQIEHLLTNIPGRPLPDYLVEEVQEWCDENLSGPVKVDYESYIGVDEITRFGRHVFLFQNENDALKFKLRYIG